MNFLFKEALIRHYCDARNTLENLPAYKREEKIKMSLLREKQINELDKALALTSKLAEKYKGLVPNNVFCDASEITLSNALSEINSTKRNEFFEEKKIASDGIISLITDKGYFMEYAKFIYQAELVDKIEQELKQANLNPEEVYQDSKK